MATSSIGQTTVVDKEHGEALLRAVREHKARTAAHPPIRPTPISEIRAVGDRRRRRD